MGRGYHGVKMGYVSILAVAVIIAFMAYFGWRGHFQPSAMVSKNTSNYQDVLSSVKTQLNASSQEEIDRAKELGNLK